MTHHSRTQARPTWRIILEIVSGLLLSVGLVSVGQIAAGILQYGRFSTNSACSAAGAFVILLIGSLLNSVAGEEANT